MIDPRVSYTSAELADALKHSEQTPRHWRVNGEGPRFYKFGKRVLYDGADVVEWLGQPRSSTSEPNPTA
jgi:hypothetical protein